MPLFSLAAADPASGSLAALLVAVAGILLATKLLGALALKLGQPSVLGELFAGVLLGPSLLGVLDPDNPVIHALAELGVLVLLFQIGLHTDLRAILQVGGPAAVVGVVGVVLPFALGLAATTALGVTGMAAILCSAALTATSIGISARVLSDLGRLDTAEGQIVLGAAVLDDVVGLIILSVLAGLAGGAALSAGSVATTAVVAVGFIVAAIVLGGVIVPPLIRLAGKIRMPGALGGLALALALLLAAAAEAAGSAMIIGAFAAGLVLHATPERHEVERATTSLGHVFVPIFFAAVAAAVDLASLLDLRVLAVGAALVVAGILGKFLAAWAPWWFKGQKAIVGVAMVPRGEVGLIFAKLGLATGALSLGLFSAVMVMVMVTTFVAPPWLAAIARPSGPPTAEPPGGIDDLVAGPRQRA